MQTAADGFVPDPSLVPKAYAAPLTGPDAVYSGLLECPCTDRISKVIHGAYSIQGEGKTLSKGLRRIATYPECIQAATKIGLPNVTQRRSQGANLSRPAGCSITVGGDGLAEQSVYFNTLESAAPCGGANLTTNLTTKVRVGGVATSLVELRIDLNAAAPGGNATLTITGPSDVWFGTALGATEMKEQPAAIVIDGQGIVSEYQLGAHVGGAKLATQVKVLSNTVSDRKRTVVLSRKFAGASAAHFSFNSSIMNDGAVLQWMNAVGATAEYSFHKTMSSSSIVLAKMGVPNCLCGNDIVFGE
jgi:hypothetical protein